MQASKAPTPGTTSPSAARRRRRRGQLDLGAGALDGAHAERRLPEP